MDRITCGICSSRKLEFVPIHIGGNGQPLVPNPIHSDKYCKDCLQTQFAIGGPCPTCNVRYLEPIPVPQVAAPVIVIDEDGSAYNGQDDENDEDDEDYEDNMEEDTTGVTDYLDEMGLNSPPQPRAHTPPAVAPAPVVPPVAPTATATAALQRAQRAADRAAVAAPQPVPAARVEVPIEPAAPAPPPAPRTAPITAEERKTLTIKQLGALEREIGIPAEHCFFCILKESKNYPNKICLVPLSACKRAANNEWYCEEHFIIGPSAKTSRELVEKKTALKKMQTMMKRKRETDLSNQQEMIEIYRREQEEIAKDKVQKKFYDLFQTAFQAAANADGPNA